MTLARHDFIAKPLAYFGTRHIK